MASMAREAWTDERLDDLKGSVDSGFRHNAEEFRSVREEFRSVREEFRAVREEFRAVRSEMSSQFAAQNRMIIQLFGGMFATMLIGFLSVIATVLAQS